MKKIITLFAVLLTIGLKAQINNVSAEEFKKQIDSGKCILIDLRTEDELKNKGWIKGSKQINWLGKDAEEQVKKLDKSKTYLLYCAGGGRSGECAELMQKSGFKHIYNLEKGFDDWKRKGFAIEQSR